MYGFIYESRIKFSPFSPNPSKRSVQLLDIEHLRHSQQLTVSVNSLHSGEIIRKQN